MMRKYKFVACKSRLLYYLVVFFLPHYNLKGQNFDNAYPKAEKMFLEILSEVKTAVMPGLTKRELFFLNTVRIKIDPDTVFSIYIGSDLDKKQINISRGFVWWIYNRSMANTIDSDTLNFHRAGILDLYDRLFVYVNPKLPVVRYAKLDNKDGLQKVSDIDNHPNLKKYFLLNLAFIYLHEIGHFVRHTSKMMNTERGNLIDIYNAVSPTDTAFKIMLQRMEHCFKYYQFEQLLEVEADAFSLEKMINNMVNVPKKGFTFSLEKIFSNSESILESYKYTKSGSELDFPKATCVINIRRQMISYTRDSLLLEKKFKGSKSEMKSGIEEIARHMEDSVREVAMVLLDLCALPSDVFEKNMDKVLTDTVLTDFTWEYYTAIIQNYLSRHIDDTSRLNLTILATKRALEFSNQASADSSHPGFNASFRLRLQEFYLFILGTIYEYSYNDIKNALGFYKQARLIGELVPASFYDKLLNEELH